MLIPSAGIFWIVRQHNIENCPLLIWLAHWTCYALRGCSGVVTLTSNSSEVQTTAENGHAVMYLSDHLTNTVVSCQVGRVPAQPDCQSAVVHVAHSSGVCCCTVSGLTQH